MDLLTMDRTPEAHFDISAASEDILAHGSRAPETTATPLPRPARRCRCSRSLRLGLATESKRRLASMASAILLLLGALVAYGVFYTVKGLRRNIVAAQRSGLPYVVVPVSPFNMGWQITCSLWTPIIKCLPRSCWEDWLDVLTPNWPYRCLLEPFQRLGDTFLTVSPSQIVMYTNDADAIRQIGARREHFLKPTENYTILEMFGRNVLTSEGSTWRMHRKATAASFNEKNAAHTFAEAISQTKGMIEHWLGPDGEGSSKTITTIERDTMTLALNIIGYVGFGLKLLWPGQTLSHGINPKLVKYGKLEPPEGYTMSFADSLATVLDKILALLLIPKWLLKILPFKSMRQALEANDNYVKFINEFLQEKIEEVKSGSQGDGMDIMGQLVRSKYGRTDEKQGGRTNQFQLSDSDITGNAFIIIVAGHETTANAMHFTLLELANNPAAQRALQADVDRLFGASDPATWDYEQSINAMMASQLAACMNETLRLMPSVVEIPKKVGPGQDQILAIDGEKHVLPESMAIILNTVAVHRNPRYWPEKQSAVTGHESDLDDFVPERWFRASAAKAEKEVEVEGADTEDYGGFKGPDTSASLFRPVRGSFIPFSDGARSCLGRRIAQVEMLAVLAVVFQKYSLELAVDEWATDEEVAEMSREERTALYKKAQHKSRDILRHASSMLTLKLHGGLYVPVRLVRRGDERFISRVGL